MNPVILGTVFTNSAEENSIRELLKASHGCKGAEGKYPIFTSLGVSG